jgi:uncharacterized membrane protein
MKRPLSVFGVLLAAVMALPATPSHGALESVPLALDTSELLAQRGGGRRSGGSRSGGGSRSRGGNRGSSSRGRSGFRNSGSSFNRGSRKPRSGWSNSRGAIAGRR